MKKLVGTMFLLGATVLMVPGTTDTFAQSKKPGKAGTIELIESKDGKFRFSIRDASGKYLGGSAVGHATEKEARAAVEELKKVLVTATYVSVNKNTEDTKKDKDK
jgi:hypothetical protein